jgi:hypothetical protein
MKSLYTKNGETKELPVITWTDGKEDKIAKTHWNREVYFDSEDDCSYDRRLMYGTTRIITKDMWSHAE